MRIEERPLVRWVPVIDGSGRQQLEMRWSVPVAAVPAPQPRQS